MKNYSLRTDMDIYLPLSNFTRAIRWKGEPYYEPITQLKMFCASAWYEYVEWIPFSKVVLENNFIVVKQIDGGEQVLNTKYIVSAEDFDLCTCEYQDDKDRINRMEFLVRPGEKVTLHDSYK